MTDDLARQCEALITEVDRLRCLLDFAVESHYCLIREGGFGPVTCAVCEIDTAIRDPGDVRRIDSHREAVPHDMDERAMTTTDALAILAAGGADPHIAACLPRHWTIGHYRAAHTAEQQWLRTHRLKTPPPVIPAHILHQPSIGAIRGRERITTAA